MTILSISHDQNVFHAILVKNCLQSIFGLGTVADPEEVHSSPPPPFETKSFIFMENFQENQEKLINCMKFSGKINKLNPQ